MGIDSKDFVIISVGELNKNKNHKVVIKAIAKLNDSCIRYIICGQGAFEAYLNQKIKQYGLEKQVMLLGYRSDIKELLNISDLFAFPSEREGLSVSLMEAMASGLPVICRNIRGNSDLITEGKGGYLNNKNKASYYADAIRKIMEAENEKGIMGRYNQDKVQNFHSKIVCERIKQLYEWKDMQGE